MNFFRNLQVFAQIYLWGLLADYLSWTVRNSLCMHMLRHHVLTFATAAVKIAYSDKTAAFLKGGQSLLAYEIFMHHVCNKVKVIHWGTSGESAASASQIVHKWAMQFIFVVTSGLQLALLAIISDFHQATFHMHGKKSFRAFCIRKKACRFLKTQIFLGQHKVLPNTVHYNSELMFLLPLSHYIFLQPPKI